MCRSIVRLRDHDQIVADEEIRAAALQFVRKVSGYNKPSQVNEQPFNAAVEEIAAAAQRLLASLQTRAEPRERQGIIIARA